VATGAIFGREAELAAIADLLAKPPAAVVVEGEPGIGKTTVWEAGVAASSARVLSCRAAGTEVQLSFAALGDLLAPVLADVLPALATPRRRALEVALLLEDPDGPPPERRAVGLAVCDCLRLLAESGPVLLAVDDAHWIDDDSARLLETLALAGSSRPVLLLMSSCDPCPSAAPDCVANVPVCLAPLDDDAAREHVIRCCAAAGPAPTDELVDWFVDAGEGNPLRLEELVSHWRTTGAQFELPPTLGALLHSRVSALGASARRVLQMAAVLGRHSTFPRIERALGFSDEVLLEALEELGRAAMVRVGTSPTSDDTLTCRHGALAEAALAQLSPPALQMLHRRAALVLETEGPLRHSTEILWDRAEHWGASGATGRTSVALACATHLVDIGLVSAALTVCQDLAGSCGDSADRALALRSLASLLHLTRAWDDLDSVIAKLRAEGSSAGAHDDIELLALDASWQRPNRWRETLPIAIECTKASEATPDHRIRAGIIALKLATNIGCSDTMHAVYRTLAPVIASDLASPVDCGSFEMIYHAVVGDFEVATRHASAILATSDQTPGARELRQMLDCAIVFARAGLLDRATATYAQMADLAARYGMPGVEAEACHRAVTMLLDRGQYAPAADWIQRYNAIVQPDSNLGRSRSVKLAGIRVALHAGDLDGARAQFETTRPGLCGDPSPMFRATALATKILLELRDGARPDAVLEPATELLQLNAEFRGMGAQDFETYVLAAALAFCGRRQEAHELISIYLKQDRRDPFPVPEEFAAIYSDQLD
jgi:hypothetical protein